MSIHSCKSSCLFLFHTLVFTQEDIVCCCAYRIPVIFVTRSEFPLRCKLEKFLFDGIFAGFYSFIDCSPRAACVPPRAACVPPRAACVPPRVACAPPRVACAPPRAACAPPRAACAPPRTACAPPRAACAPPRTACAPPRTACAPPRAACAPPRAACAPPRVGSESAHESCRVTYAPFKKVHMSSCKV